ncbi:MAG: HEAT repeat domain-containing protein [Anaerolineales bacterium]|nr:HEAT repeat domain-containing protein [Anaerolineales bacterium]
MSDLKSLLADLTSGDEPRAETAAVQFVSLGKPALYVLASMIASTDPDTRWWALRAISEFDSPRTAHLLLLGLDDSETEVKACAALGLRKHPNIKAIPKLVKYLGSEDQLLSRLCRDALVAIGKPATPHLIEVLESPEKPHKARLEAVRALAEIEDPNSISALFKVFQEEAGLMQYWAEQGLERMGIGMVFFESQG